MNKTTFIILALLLILGGFAVFFLTRNTTAPSSTTNTSQNTNAAGISNLNTVVNTNTSSSFDTNDNLDEALNDLDQVDQ